VNKKEAVEKCNKHGIYQLNKGESLGDALDYIDNGTSRKGYKYRKNDGSLMSENEIIRNENKIAFHKSFTPPEYNEGDVGSIDDIQSVNDFREDREKRGVIINCFYCGDCLRVDSDKVDDEDGDYSEPQDTVHCESCMNAAISRLAM